jgi:hypothetical protein
MQAAEGQCWRRASKQPFAFPQFNTEPADLSTNPVSVFFCDLARKVKLQTSVGRRFEDRSSEDVRRDRIEGYRELEEAVRRISAK